MRAVWLVLFSDAERLYVTDRQHTCGFCLRCSLPESRWSPKDRRWGEIAKKA